LLGRAAGVRVLLPVAGWPAWPAGPAQISLFFSSFFSYLTVLRTVLVLGL
jgi:hypothetical protein